MYQSLHTTVIGPYGERMEVQIRTHEMHRVAEMGIAAHWLYKGSSANPEDAERFAWLRQLLEEQHQAQDAHEFIGSVKEGLFAEEVFVFTPKGDVLVLPEGSTVVDFAYRIHSEVGHHCLGARVNGRLVPLRYRLKTGDTVEIITTANQVPSKDWLKFVKTTRARSRIRNWIKYQQRERSVAIGHEILERDLRRHHLDLATLRKDGRLAEVLAALSLKDEESLLAAVGYGRVTTRQVLAKLLPPEELAEGEARREGALRRLLRMVSRGDKSGVRVSGVEDVLVRFGRCCDPLPGERIVGFVTLGRGVTVHASDCPRILESDPQRRVEVVWDGTPPVPRPVRLEVTCVDEPGLLAGITRAISSAGINIKRADVRSFPDKRAVNFFELMVSTADQLNRAMREIGKVPGVTKVARARG